MSVVLSAKERIGTGHVEKARNGERPPVVDVCKDVYMYRKTPLY